LEVRGLKVYLVNARHMKNVPGRKSDYVDCQWIQKLHTLGFLTGSFRPEAQMCRLRAYLRHRASLLQHRSPHIQHMQKALLYMNLQLPQVVSDITGTTGLAIVRAIVAGERDAVTLARLRQPTCQSSQETIAKALSGDWKPEQLFILKQALALYDFYSQQVAACDVEIQQQFASIRPAWPIATDLPPIPPAKPSTQSKNAPLPSTRADLIRMTGLDLVAVPGISASLAQTSLSEIGTDMTQWPTSKHFASWLGLAPHNDISGGKVLRSRTLTTDNRAGQAFRQAASSVTRSQNVFGAFYRRKRTYLGPQQALVATAHKIARTVYHMLRHHVAYQEVGAATYEQQQRDRDLVFLRKKAAKLGLVLTVPELDQ
jgi:transposase